MKVPRKGQVTMRRRATFAGRWLLISTLAAQVGCSYLGLRLRSERPIPTMEEAAQAQQIIEHAQTAIDQGDLPTAEQPFRRKWLERPRQRSLSSGWEPSICSKADLADAKGCFSRALKLDPDYVDALIGLGRVETEEGDAEAARKRFETAIEIDPHRSQAHFSLGSVLQIMGQTDAALAEFFRTLEGEPNHAEANRCIAAIQLTKNQPEQALSRLNQVLEMAADDGEARFLRGRAQLAIGHTSQAIADLNSAITKSTRPG